MTSAKKVETSSPPSTETVQAPSSDIWAALNDFLTKEQKPNTLKAYSACLWSAIDIAVIAYFMFRTGNGTNIQAPTHEERDTLPLVRRVEDRMQLGSLVEIQLTSELCKYMCSMWTIGCVGSTHIRSRIKGREDQGFCVLWTWLSDDPPAQLDGIGSFVVDLASSDIVQQMEYMLSSKASRAASKATTAIVQKVAPTGGALTITSKEVYSPQAESVAPDQDPEQVCNRKPVWTVTRIATITEHPGCGSSGY
ncbi:hypothetical protein LTR56_008430 [Elasticomyces elasticus]|nr:hypothetical protein LTR22_016769 [Elasticomyces elasticus]KAK3646666.1 hypothetical protein LTR56_008430 [Elasticomyces elasticus]KAK4913758.1 hypothetical protein LTR49_017906 [Elasticomyces elasticus]KAK5735270.1 hypothetical protein LTR17_008277 [Elasticomyces elasticus]KAK5757969.1 hypothetical protein LTS12_011864 [Elasticomyces elasticus]